jgi:nucleotide-binding universal stress UspA family protein
MTSPVSASRRKPNFSSSFSPTRVAAAPSGASLSNPTLRALLCDTRSDHECDLILMPTHGYGALHRLVAGSITADVLHQTPCPVWTGPHVESDYTFRNVVCALDLARENRAVLAWAAGFAREFGATLRIVHVISMFNVRSGGVYFDPQWRAHVAHESRSRIADLQRELATTAEARIELGEIPEAVVTAARDVDGDLLVIGRGPKAYSILRECDCPVVVI